MRMKRAIGALVVVGGLVAGMASQASAAKPSSPVLSLKGAAGRFDTTSFKSLGNSTDAQASWTKGVALDGKFSMSLTKATNDQFAFAAAIVKGVEGMSVSDLGTISFAFTGVCSGGSPRFNLYYDSNGDGVADGVAFYGCNNVANPDLGNGFLGASFDATTPPFDAGPGLTGASKVVQLSVLIDIVGSTNIDRVGAAGQTVGEP